MLARLFKYTIEEKDIFENILKDENIMLNHMIIESGKFFPKHPTDAHVYIIVVKGELSISLGDETKKTYKKGDVIDVDKGIESFLGNESDDFTECFVIKVG